jgi:HlyD family secretion protein
VLRVPAGALFRRGGEWAVFVVKDGRATLRAVQTGRRGGWQVEVMNGLTKGEEVILHPSDRVTDGVRVAPRPSG